MNKPEAIAHLDEVIARNRNDKPDCAIEVHRVFGSELLLDELSALMIERSNIEVEKWLLSVNSTGGLSAAMLFLKAKQHVGKLALAFTAFVGLRRCRLAIKLKGQEISIEAPTAEEMEKILRVADELFIHPNDKTE